VSPKEDNHRRLLLGSQSLNAEGPARSRRQAPTKFMPPPFAANMRPARAKAQTKPRTPAVVGAPWVTSVSRSAGATMLSGRFRFVAALRPAMVAVQRPATKPLHTSGQQANAGISSPRHGGSLRVLRTAGRPRPTSRPGDRFKKVGWVLRGSFRDL